MVTPEIAGKMEVEKKQAVLVEVKRMRSDSNPSPALEKDLELGAVVTYDDDSTSVTEKANGAGRGWSSRLRGFSPVKAFRKRFTWWRFTTWTVILLTLASIAFLTHTALVRALLHRLKPQIQPSGFQTLADNFQEPASADAWPSTLPVSLSRDITPKRIHSHNDYWRRAPLYQALSAGCTGVEADIHLENGDLLVGHVARSLRPYRTLKSLYINPLLTILEQMNSPTIYEDGNKTTSGVFEQDPDQSLVLLLDFKTSAKALWPVVYEQLEPLRQKGWLTTFNSSVSDVPVVGPITVVATGNADFETVIANSTYRYIFFDAPLDDLSSGKYNQANSHYASVSLKKAVGTPTGGGHFKDGQKSTMKKQIDQAADLGLASRYWDLPPWPLKARFNVWSYLTENDIGMLNADDVYGAAWWNWNWCVIAGLDLCK